ncbi:MAG: hypothetical protein ACQEQS_04035 [Thermodesulfobacteriota bacterium]
MKNKKDLTVGLVLIAAAVAVAARYFYLKEDIETSAGSVFFLRLAFIIFVILLGGAGIKKIVSARGLKDGAGKKK